MMEVGPSGLRGGRSGKAGQANGQIMFELTPIPISPARRTGRRTRSRPWALAIVLVGVLGLAGCGSSSSSAGSAGAQHVHFAKTKFVLHAGLAFGAFHRYIYKPFRSGGFTPPLSHKAAIVKAGVAALFVYHEVKIALMDARSSPLLSKLVKPLTAMQDKVNALRQSLHGGHLDSTGINAANSAVSSIGAQSAHSGTTIRDLATSGLDG
jgi:hypothetical protein